MTESPDSHPVPSAKQSSFHAAASFCLLSPVVAFFINVFILPKTPVNTEAEALVHTLMVSTVPLLGIFAGLFSLFGIKRHGCKGILWKSVAGLLIWGLLLAVAVPTLARVRADAQQASEPKHRRPAP